MIIIKRLIISHSKKSLKSWLVVQNLRIALIKMFMSLSFEDVNILIKVKKIQFLDQIELISPCMHNNVVMLKKLFLNLFGVALIFW